MTIEERAKEAYPIYRTEEYGQRISITHSNIALAKREAYIKGATDQQKIDDEEEADVLFIQRQMLTEKACKWLNVNLVDTDTFDKEWFIGLFKKAMEGVGMTIEERANEYVGHAIEIDEDISASQKRLAYIQGATEQQQIDR